MICAQFSTACDPASKDVLNASRNGLLAVTTTAVRLGCPHRGKRERGKREHSLN
jgi:hypothetical protein